MRTILAIILTLFFAIGANAYTDLKGDYKAILNAYHAGTFWPGSDKKEKFEEFAFDHLSCRITGTPQNPGKVKCDGNQSFNGGPEAFRGQAAVTLYKALQPNFAHNCNSTGCETNEINGYCVKVHAPYIPLPIYSYRCVSDFFCFPEEKAAGKCTGTGPMSDYYEFKSYNSKYRQQ